MTSYCSPFQKWMDENMKGIVASQDIMYLIALAFRGGIEAAEKASADAIKELK